MKRKLALLLAGVMTLSAVPSMNLFAASTALLSRDVVSIERDWFLRDTLTGVAASGASLPIQGSTPAGVYRTLGDPYARVGNSQPGVDLIIRLDSSVRESNSREFEVVLNGAEFAFERGFQTSNTESTGWSANQNWTGGKNGLYAAGSGMNASFSPGGNFGLSVNQMTPPVAGDINDRMFGWFQGTSGLTVGTTPSLSPGGVLVNQPSNIPGIHSAWGNVTSQWSGARLSADNHGLASYVSSIPSTTLVDIKREPMVAFSPYWSNTGNSGFVEYYRPSGIPNMIVPEVFSNGQRGSALASASLSGALAEFRHAELAYTLRYSTDNPNTAYITINEEAVISNFNTDGRVIRIPLITRIRADEATVAIRGNGASVSSTAPIIFATSRSGGATAATIAGVKRFRTTESLDAITITELRVGTMKLSTENAPRYFELEFPQGFNITNDGNDPIRITMLGFGNNSVNVGSLNQQAGMPVGDRARDGGWEVNPLFSPIPNSSITARRGRNVLRIQMPIAGYSTTSGGTWAETGTASFNTAPGRIVIANLKLSAIEDEADFGDIRVQILDDNFPNQSTTTLVWSASAPANAIRQTQAAVSRSEYSYTIGNSTANTGTNFLTETNYDQLINNLSSFSVYSVNGGTSVSATRPPSLLMNNRVVFTVGTAVTLPTIGALAVGDQVTIWLDRVAGQAQWEVPLAWGTDGSNYNTWDAEGSVAGTTRSYRAEVTDETLLVAHRLSYALRFETTNAIPTLVNGRYPENRTNNILTNADFNARHLAARVVFEELAPDSWWANRETNFVLPEGVKIIQARLYANDAIADNNSGGSPAIRRVINEKYTWSLSTSPTATGTSPYAYETSGMDAYVLTRANSLRLFGITIRNDQQRRANIGMELWLSIEPGFEGDIMLGVEGTGVPEGIPAIKIAEAINPVTVETSITSVKIGFQSQDVANIRITENGTGFLQRDKDIRLYVEDFARASDSIIVGTGLGSGASAQPNITVEGGGLRLEIPRTVASDLRTGMTVRTASSTGPGTIEIRDVWVRMDRNVPVTNREPYQLFVGGTAIAANYVGFLTNNNVPTTRQLSDRFERLGIGVDFLRVITAATNEAGGFVTMVEIPVDESFMIVDGVRREIPVPAWIDASTSATMLPVRAIAMALGIPYESVVWDPSDADNPRVTVITANRVVQFTIGSEFMSLNGERTVMYNSNNSQTVRAQIRDGSSFVPIRAFEAAFGITISWREADRTVVLNPDFGV